MVDFACGARGARPRRSATTSSTRSAPTTTRWPASTRPAATSQFAFGTETRETRVSLDDAAPAASRSFVLLGVEHILTGWDHLLFLLALLLRGGGWLSLAKIVTAFTLAHSVTLTLAALDIVALPDRLVEAVIALSIAVVAAENLFLQPVVVAPVARQLRASGSCTASASRPCSARSVCPRTASCSSLFGFNVGVELGQALVVAVALPAAGAAPADRLGAAA